MSSIIDKALQQSIKNQVKETVLWQNASPNSSFAAQKINVSVPSDAAVYATYAYSGSNPIVAESPETKIGKSGYTTIEAGIDGTSGLTVRMRDFDVESDGISFGNCSTKTSNNFKATEVTNNYMIPLFIYAKRVLGGVIHKLITLATRPRREVLA